MNGPLQTIGESPPLSTMDDSTAELSNLDAIENARTAQVHAIPEIELCLTDEAVRELGFQGPDRIRDTECPKLILIKRGINSPKFYAELPDGSTEFLGFPSRVSVERARQAAYARSRPFEDRTEESGLKPSETLTLEELFSDFCKNRLAQRSEGYRKTFRSVYSRIIKPKFGTCRIGLFDASAFVAELSDNYNLTVDARKQALRHVKILLGYAVSTGLLSQNPFDVGIDCAEIYFPRAAKALEPTQTQGRLLSLQEIAQVVRHAENLPSPWNVIIPLSVRLGQRDQITRSLRWEYWNPIARLWGCPDPTLPSNRRHTVFVTDAVSSWLTHAVRREGFFGLVFPSPRDPLSPITRRSAIYTEIKLATPFRSMEHLRASIFRLMVDAGHPEDSAALALDMRAKITMKGHRNRKRQLGLRTEGPLSWWDAALMAEVEQGLARDKLPNDMSQQTRNTLETSRLTNGASQD